jgi:hypothetical protein
LRKEINMPLFALVDMTPNDENLFPVVNLENRSTRPPEINGHRWLAQSEFAEGAQAGIGLFWTGSLPAEFVEKPAPEVSADTPETVSEALEAAKAKMLEGIAMVDAALARQG